MNQYRGPDSGSLCQGCDNPGNPGLPEPSVRDRCLT
jgi:hypothetical protein